MLWFSHKRCLWWVEEQLLFKIKQIERHAINGKLR
ncbi:hypothetical protein THOM_1064 [Trachipleistophora hominis]|uniref:Uncharacterized protein n=1 Tax=Trachipleistophora hominis TaxID=72359 RepID=L7JXB8_TRAHO|nr:hypothetical protein THOM_1064 [Trachipleistophora hominis]